MSGYKEFTSATCHYHIHSRIFRLGKQCQFRHLQDILPTYLCMTAVRYIKTIIKATKNRMVRFQYPMFEDTEHLLFQRIFRNSIMMIEPGLRRPTYIQSRSHMRTCPIKNFRNLIPISHFLEIHLFHRCSRNNHTIILLMTHLVEIRIERLHVFYRCILGGMTFDLHKRDLHLKRSI